MKTLAEITHAPPGTLRQTQDITKYFKNVSLLGCQIANLSMNQTVDIIHKIIETKTPHQHCVLNAGKIVLMYRESKLKKIIQSCPLVNADGQSVVWALKLLGRPLPERVTGIDLMECLLKEADKKKYRIYFLGGTPSVNESMVEKVKLMYPNIQIGGRKHGYFSEKENEAVMGDISRSYSDILFIAMGSPKKEYWLAENLELTKVPFCMGVGGSFDVFVGKAKRAPRWIQNIGMEWFYRFIQEPRRLWKRYLIDNFIFIFLVFTELMKWRTYIKRTAISDLKEKEIA